MYLLSANGTLRTILILLIVWQLLRLWMRVQAARRDTHRKQGPAGPPRPKGDVRIERVEESRYRPGPPTVEDADYEVIKDEPEH
jgi:hypothetical protein